MESLFLQQTVNGLIVGSIYCLMATGLTMIFGVMRISNFAHGDFLMIGLNQLHAPGRHEEFLQEHRLFRRQVSL